MSACIYEVVRERACVCVTYTHTIFMPHCMINFDPPEFKIRSFSHHHHWVIVLYKKLLQSLYVFFLFFLNIYFLFMSNVLNNWLGMSGRALCHAICIYKQRGRRLEDQTKEEETMTPQIKNKMIWFIRLFWREWNENKSRILSLSEKNMSATLGWIFISFSLDIPGPFGRFLMTLAIHWFFIECHQQL